MPETLMLPRQTRAAEIRASSYNADDNSVDVTWSTGASVKRYSYRDGEYNEMLDMSPSAVRLGRLNAGAPFLNTHSSDDLRDIIGSVVPGSAKIEGGKGVAKVRLSQEPQDADIVGKIKSGIINNVSVGYRVHTYERKEATGDSKLQMTARDWEPYEISAVPIPADAGAQIRSDDAGVNPCIITGDIEDAAKAFRAAEKARVTALRDIGGKLGLSQQAIEQHVDAGTSEAAFRVLAIDLKAEAARQAETSPSHNGANAMSVAKDTAATDGAAAVTAESVRAEERARATEIRVIGRKLRLDDSLIEQHIDAGTGVDAFRAAAIDAAVARQAGDTISPNPGATDRTYAAAASKKPPGTDFARALIALAATRGDKRSASDLVAQRYGRDGDLVARALSTSIGSGGGFLVPAEMSGEVIELLRPASTVMSLGPVVMAMPTGNMSIPALSAAAGASYQGENMPQQSSQPQFGMVQLSAKKLIAMVALSNDMIRYASAQTDGIIRDDMVRSIATRADLAFLRGNGSAFSPRGLRSFAAAPVNAGANVLTPNPLVGSAYAAGSQASAIQAVASVTGDLSNCVQALENANIPMIRPGWIMSPRSKNYLMNLRDGLGNYVYNAQMSLGRLMGYPYKTTTQIPNNLATVNPTGAATVDGSEVYLADFAQVVIGEAYGIELDVFAGGTYVDQNGVTQSGISNDQTVMRAIVQHDLNMRHEQAVVYLNGVRWF